jgi:hypothetical protein
LSFCWRNGHIQTVVILCNTADAKSSNDHCRQLTNRCCCLLLLLLLLLLLPQSTKGDWPHLLFRESAASHPADRAKQKCLAVDGE